MIESLANGMLMSRAYSGMRELGIDADEVMRRCGLNLPSDRTVYASVEEQLARHRLFWPQLEAVSDDAFIGLHLGEVVPVLSGQIIEYLFMSSPNFKEGLIRCIKYTRLLTDLFQSRVELDDNPCALTFDIPDIDYGYVAHMFDCVLVGNIRFFQHLTGGAFKPIKVSLTRAAPEDTQEYERVFQCAVEFSASSNTISFDREILALGSLHADAGLLLMHEKIADEQILQIEKRDLLMEARQVIGELLETGGLSLEVVAERLGMTGSRLRAHFAELETSFNQVLSDYRFELARELLGQTEEPIDQIVYLTGFSEPSTFYRAFKRWTGTTPIVYRRQVRNPDTA